MVEFMHPEMEDVELAEREEVEMVEVPGRKNLVPKEIAEKFDEAYSESEKWIKEGIRHRIDTRGEKFAEHIARWLYAKINPIIMDGGHAWKHYILTSNMQIGPAFTRKYSIRRGERNSITELGWLPEDPKLGLSYAERDVSEIRDIPTWDIVNDANTYENPINNCCTDVHMNWSSDVNYPYCFAHISDPYVFMFCWREAYEEGYAHVSPVQNGFKLVVNWGPRVITNLGNFDAKIPGRHVRERHRMKREKPNMELHPWTSFEKEAVEEWGERKSPFESFMEEKENEEYFKEEFGCETIEEFRDKMEKGKLEDKEVAPGVRTYLNDEIPGEVLFRRAISFWEENYRVDPESGEIENFGEVEPDAHVEILESIGYDREDAEEVAEADEPLDHWKRK